MSIVTFITRVVPFLVFKRNAKIPAIITFLEKFIPGMVMMILVIYCLKDISFSNIPGSLNLVISSIIVVLLHLFKKNALLSIVGGTAAYMILVQTDILTNLLSTL